MIAAGPERTRLEALASRPEMDGRGPRRSGQDDGVRYDTARILGHPAVFQGRSAASRILHGLLVVAPDACSSVNRLIEPPATGRLVPEGDFVHHFTEGLRQLMHNPPPVADREAAARQLQSRLDPDRILDRWEQLLRGLPD